MEGLCRVVLALYPPQFRRRFGDEWLAVAQWHLQRADAGRARAVARWIVRDALVALPAVWLAALREHVQTRAQSDARRAGGTPTSAMRGGPPGTRPGPYGVWRAYAFIDDLLFAVRSLRRAPGFAAAAVGTLAIGIGACVGIFAVVNAVLLRPLPYPEPDRLAMVWNDLSASGLSRLPLSPAQVLALRDNAELFEDVGGVWATGATLTDLDEPLQVSMAMVTTNFYRVLGVEPALGRDFTDADNLGGDGPAVILSDELWRSAFGADPAIVGATIVVEGDATPVVGVLPPGVRLTLPADSSVPARFDLYMSYPQPLSAASPAQFFLRVVARLRPGVSVAEVRERLGGINAIVAEQYGDLMPEGVAMTAMPLHADAVREVEPVLGGLLGGVALVLLLGCANAAGMLSTRLTRRRRELATRRCLGASRARVVRQQLFEGALLSAAALLLGGGGGYAVARVLWRLRPAALSRFQSVPLDGAVVGVALVAAAAASAVFATVAALQVPRPGAAVRALAQGASSTSRWRRWALPTFEVAVTVVLLVSAALLARTILELRRVDLGYDAGEQLSFRVAISPYRFPAAAERTRLARLIEEQVGALAGVTAIGGSSHVPFDDVPNWSSPAAPEGTPESEREAHYADHRSVTQGYLRAIGARLIDGRDFEPPDDTRDANVVIVDRALAERHWPDQRAVGKTLVVTQYRDGSFEPAAATVIGVVDTIRAHDLARPGEGVVFVPFSQSARWQLSYVVRARDSDGLAERIRETVAGLGAGLAAADFRPLRGWVQDAMAPARLTAILAEMFAAIALTLACAGLYAVVAFGVAQRQAEIGLRMALGADRGVVFRSVVRDGALVGVAGLIIGVPAALLAGRWLDSFVFGVRAGDPALLTGVALLTIFITAAASAAPAWYAARIDPARSIRNL